KPKKQQWKASSKIGAKGRTVVVRGCRRRSPVGGEQVRRRWLCFLSELQRRRFQRTGGRSDSEEPRVFSGVADKSKSGAIPAIFPVTISGERAKREGDSGGFFRSVQIRIPNKGDFRGNR
ncbi:hypothetical protein U1Q18_029501, partial [Sarracenia purpurea var. burkii]